MKKLLFVFPVLITTLLMADGKPILSNPQAHEITLSDYVDSVVYQNTRLYTTLNRSYLQMFNMVWHSPKFTPQQVFDQFGENAGKFCRLSAQIQALLSAANPSYVPPTRPANIVINSDGTVTVVPIPE
jgi:hypothetical protein